MNFEIKEKYKVFLRLVTVNYLLRFYCVSISSVDLLGVMYPRFYIFIEFGAIEYQNHSSALTMLLLKSHREKYLLQIFLILVYLCNYVIQRKSVNFLFVNVFIFYLFFSFLPKWKNKKKKMDFDISILWLETQVL